MHQNAYLGIKIEQKANVYESDAKQSTSPVRFLYCMQYLLMTDMSVGQLL